MHGQGPHPGLRWSGMGNTWSFPQDVLSLSGRKDMQNNTKWEMIFKNDILPFPFISVFLFASKGESHISIENKDSLSIFQG